MPVTKQDIVTQTASLNAVTERLKTDFSSYAEGDISQKKQKAALDIYSAVNLQIQELKKDPEFRAAANADENFKKSEQLFFRQGNNGKRDYKAHYNTDYVYDASVNPVGQAIGATAAIKTNEFLANAGTVTGDAVNKGMELVSKLGNAAKNLGSGAPASAASAAPEDIDLATGLPRKKGWMDSIKDFFKDLDIGDIVGGLAGGFGGWMLGNIFGGGLIGKIAGVGLAIAGIFMGQRAFGGTINGWLGRNATGSGATIDTTTARPPVGIAASRSVATDPSIAASRSIETDPAMAEFMAQEYQRHNAMIHGVAYTPQAGNSSEPLRPRTPNASERSPAIAFPN